MSDPPRTATLADPYVTDEIFDALPPQPYASADYAVRSAPATRLLKDNDVIDLGDRHFEVIHTPGHSPGGIALWEAKTATLFSGDIVYDGPLIEDTYHADAGDYYKSMVRLYDLPVRTVHGGHFGSYDQARHREIIRAWLDEKEKGCAAGKSGRSTGYHTKLTPFSAIGRLETRSALLAAIALASAGAAGGVPGSPPPVGASADVTICVSIAPMSLMRSGS